MAGYLDQYGESEQRREKTYRRLLAAGIIALVLLIAWWFLFVWSKSEIVRAQSVARFVQVLRNHRQETEVKKFLGLIAGKQYDAAYRLWGCTEAHPCRDYPFTAFMQDWGAQSQRAASFVIARSRSCGSGVIVTVATRQGGEENLWVQKSDETLGFSPFSSCPSQ